MKIEFDATIDELVDVHLRLTADTAANRSQRRLSQLFTALCAAGVFATSVPWHTRQPLGLLVAFAVGGTLLLAAAVWFVQGRVHDWYVRRHAYRALLETYGEDAHWVFEIRDDGLWSRARDVELLLPWSGLTRITEADDVELWFDTGLAAIRARALSSADDRQRFLTAVKQKMRRD
jgi:hypothetical protein